MSDDRSFRVGWIAKAAFAEIAEALAIPTDHIVAAFTPPERPDVVLVMFSRELPADVESMTQEEIELHDVYKAAFERDADGILRLAHGPEIEPGFWQGLREHLESD